MRANLAACLAAGSLAAYAPAASADHDVAQCRYNAVIHPAVTGDGELHGTAEGVVVAPGDTPTIRCEVRVNGVTRAATPTSLPGPGVSAVAGFIRFIASDVDVVRLCAVTTTSHGTRDECYEPTPLPIPPPVVTDALNEVLAEFDAATCPILASYAPGSGPVTIDTDGDVWIAGERAWDCPPFAD
ncbi:MAG TPA: hypothetical protein VNA20_02250 [Frankiaceae bacterium]|nr:hypothetical protein [Frankiaceae bacterium]